MKGGVEGARPRLKLVYGNTRTTVHSTKQRKSRGPARDPGPGRTSRYTRDDLRTMLRRMLLPSSRMTSSVPNKVHHCFRRFQAFMQLPPSQMGVSKLLPHYMRNAYSGKASLCGLCECVLYSGWERC